MRVTPKLQNPETGKLDLVKLGKWAGAIVGILTLLGIVIGAGWKAYDHMATLEKAAAAATRANTRLDALTEAVRTVDTAARDRDATNARAVAVIENTVDVLHGGTYEPVKGYGASGRGPRGRAAQIAAARHDAEEAAAQVQQIDEESDEDPLAGLDDL